MQTLTIGASRYTLAPTRNVGELQAKLAKCTGKYKPIVSRRETRGMPEFKAGVSTADYVRHFWSLNGLGDPNKFFGPLNKRPCEVYTGEDLHEVIDDLVPEFAEPVPAPAAAPRARQERATKARVETVPVPTHSRITLAWHCDSPALQRAHERTTLKVLELCESGLMPSVSLLSREWGPDNPLWGFRAPAGLIARRMCTQALRLTVARMVRSDRAQARRLAVSATQRKTPREMSLAYWESQAAEGRSGAARICKALAAPVAAAPIHGESEPVPVPMDDEAPHVLPYRYAKGAMVAQCKSADGFKTRAAILAEQIGMRWVNRAGGYVGSAKQAARLQELFAELPAPADLRPPCGAPIIWPEFERSYAAARTAQAMPATPWLRIPAFDARHLVPAQFAPRYLMRAGA